MNKWIIFLLGVGLSVSRVQAAFTIGQTIGIDFGTISPAASENFNAYADVVIANGVTESFSGTLIDTDGSTVDGVGFSVQNNSGQATGRATASTGTEGYGLMTDSSVYSDWLISNNTTTEPLDVGGHFVFTFTGLDDSIAYDLAGGWDSDNNNFDAIWAADGQSFTTDTTASIGYGTLSGLTTDGSGNLEITVSRNTFHVTAAGLTLTAVTPPLPSMESGDVICVDFGTTVPSSGNYNVINSGILSITNLVLFSDGSSVDVGLDVTATNPFDNAGDAASTAGLANINTTDADVYEDGFLSAYTAGTDNDIITLTFTGLDDSLYYDLSGGLSRSSSPENFSTTWSASGVSSQIADGTEANGHVEFFSLMSSGGTLTVILTDNIRQSGLAQLALVATDTPPVSELPEAPELPDGVTVIFDPTATDAYASLDDLNAVTVGGSWDVSLPDTSRFDANTGDGFFYLMDGASAQGDSMELILADGGLYFSSTDVAIHFEMLADRASATVGEKHTTLFGYDGTNEIFRLKYDSNSDNSLNTVTVTTGDGEESMGSVPLRWITENSGPPSGLQDFRIVLSGGQVSFSGSSLSAQEGPVLNSAQTLTSLKWEITGSATDNQGLWLDDIQVRHGLPGSPRDAMDRPNIIFVLMDDLGYSDISCYGGTKVDTPNIDALASGGLQFTTFLLPANVCSPSRASFLTGAYPQRCGIPMAVNEPLQNHWFLGLDPDEITIAEQCRGQGYKTFMIGKWHLGTEDVFLPFNQGFDRWLGTWGNGGTVYDEGEVAYATFPETTLTSLYTQRVRKHIRDNKDQPFLLYYAHNYPHDPFTEGNAFDGSTGNGTRPDVLKEVDWSIGQMVAELEAQGLLDNTLIIFSSDNGATPPYKSYACVPFQGSKYVTWEGGHRVPFIMYWKGQIQTPAVLDEPQIRSMDLFPTVSELVGAEVPDDRVYDGTSLVPLLTEQDIDREADEPFFYYTGDNLQCVRVGDWKLHIPRTEYQLPWWDQIKPPPSTYQLYELSSDPGESTDVSAANPDIVATLSNLAVNIVLELGNPDPDTGIMVWGSGQRGTGTIFPEVPTILNNESDYSYVPDWNTLTAAEKGRGATRDDMDGIIDAANEYIDASGFPAGWQYLEASESIGGTEVALISSTVVGSEGNTGFGGADTSAVLGSADIGTFVIDSDHTANNGVAGTDLLIVPDDDSDRDYVIVRYTIDENDVSFGKTRASISGSFRDLVGTISDDSVTAQVFHNGTELFSVTGSNGQLTQAAGTFDLSDITVAEGDTISFVVGCNGDSDGDEVALSASFEFAVSANSQDHVATIDSDVKFLDGRATLRFSGTPGQGYVTEWTDNLSESDSWIVVDDLPFLPTSPYTVYVDAEANKGFWKIELDE
jgi:arylsulfatase A-like enzyme